MKPRVGLLVAALFALHRPVHAERPVDYLRDIKPILTERCASCHGAVRQKAELRLDAAALLVRGGASGPAVVPGKSHESLLIDRVTSDDAQVRMPPESEGIPLGAEEIALLRSWIDQGAKATPEKVPDSPRTHWAFQIPARPPIPEVRHETVGANPVDAFLAAAHRANGLVPSGPVTRDLWLRRVYLDLIGLPPTREALHAFRQDSAPDAAERVVDALLARPEYGERWGRHWMDVWRYSDWYGLLGELRFSHPHIWRWRDWIVESLNADRGYDRMIVEMLAGDELAPDDPSVVRATGFLARNWEIFSRNVWLSNTVEHTARAFLGVTIQCARCHDHKFDPIAQTEYYRLRAFFEPYHVRIDRVPGQPDKTKDGVSRVFDDFLDAPTYLFVRGDETNPRNTPLTPATPAILGGELKIAPVSLSRTAAVPDKREFVIRELLAAADAAVRQASDALGGARTRAAQASQALAAAETGDREAAAKVTAAGPPTDANKPIRDAAARALEQRHRARQTARDAAGDVGVMETALRAAQARRDALAALIDVERLEDAGASENDPASWTEAALHAAFAQRREAVRGAEHDRTSARRSLDRAERTLDGLTGGSVDAKNATVQAAVQKASAEAVDARAKLADAEARLAKARAAAEAPAGTAYTPRSLDFNRAKTTYRDTPSNAPYAKVSTGRRLALARWITDRRNPLTARVAVNHIWARHFGEPLAPSTYDFGLRAARPPLQELLDWLAVELIDSGWSMKHIHRLIVTSRAYRMESSDGPANSANRKVDPDNHLFWRANVKRMEGEVVRDCLLSLSGRLDSRLGGPELPVADSDMGTRRSIYYRYARDERIPFLTMFDPASVEECYRRHETIVPQQALALINSKLVLAKSVEIAAVIDREVGEGDGPEIASGFVVSAFERILGRPPTAAEQAECTRALDRLSGLFAAEKRPGVVPHRKARADLVHVLLNHNDFLSIR